MMLLEITGPRPFTVTDTEDVKTAGNTCPSCKLQATHLRCHMASSVGWSAE
jgi:hypothetical protein